MTTLREKITFVLTALAYAAGGWVFSVAADGSVRFRGAAAVDRVAFYEPNAVSIQYGGETARLVNLRIWT